MKDRSFGMDERFKEVAASPGPGEYEQGVKEELKRLKNLFTA